MTVFQRDPATGALAFGQCWAETVHGDCTKAFPESGALIGVEVSLRGMDSSTSPPTRPA